VVPRLGVDEKAIAKRHRYLTVIADPVQSRVLYLADERKPESLDGFRPMLTEAQPAGIQAVAMGMGEPYVQSARAALPEAGATIVFDKFHVVKHPDDAVHEVQRAEHRVLKQGASCMRSPESEVRRPIRRYDAPLLWQASTDWHGFRVVSSRYDAAGHREFDWQIPELMLAIRLSGQTHHEARFDGGRTERFVVCAGQVRLLPADQRVRGHTQGDGTTRNALLLLEPDWIARASGGEFDLSRLDLRWSSDLRNPLILEALLGLVREVEQPGLMGRIYAESLALAILTELVRHYLGAPSQAEGIASRRLPRITEYIEAIIERILTEFSDRNFGGGTPFTLPLSGSPAFKSFPAVSTDKAVAQAELRRRPSDSPRPSGPEIPAGMLVPDGEWSFASCPSGPPGTPSTTDICLAGGFQNNMVYELRYRATNSPVMGLGYVTSRDYVSFLRHAAQDDTGAANHVHGLATTLCQGISSSGMFYRDYLYQGFNEDEEGRRVCDGVHIHIPGVQKLFLNYRFAQPNPFTVQHRERYVPDTNFPRRYQRERDPLTGGVDGILTRPKTDPKVFHSDTSTEWWQFRSSLVDTNDDGTKDRRHPNNVRRYLFSSTQHYPTKGATPSFGTGNRQCEQLSNVTHPGVYARALIVALHAWVQDNEQPPESRVPQIKNGTLVPPETLAFPRIPGVTLLGLYNGSGDRDFGPRVEGNRGVIDTLIPVVLTTHRVLVPQVDMIGNDVAGIRHPFVEAPIATLTGWNTRRPEFTAGDLCDLTGMTVPLKRTAAERLVAGDPRPSLEELYGTHEGYVTAVRAAAEALAAEGLMLPEDVQQTIAEAEASDVLR
jgi:Alpha/beta hydrolase domain/Transposase